MSPLGLCLTGAFSLHGIVVVLVFHPHLLVAYLLIFWAPFGPAPWICGSIDTHIAICTTHAIGLSIISSLQLPSVILAFSFALHTRHITCWMVWFLPSFADTDSWLNNAIASPKKDWLWLSSTKLECRGCVGQSSSYIHSMPTWMCSVAFIFLSLSANLYVLGVLHQLRWTHIKVFGQGLLENCSFLIAASTALLSLWNHALWYITVIIPPTRYLMW